MNEISQVRSNNWIQLIHSCQESGLTVKDWCSHLPFCKNPRSRIPVVRRSPDDPVVNGEPFVETIPGMKYAMLSL